MSASPSGLRWGLAIHGGSGNESRAEVGPEQEAVIRAALAEALRAGHAVLARGGPSLEAVTAAIQVLEDAPCFNAGRGAVFTHDGHHELDASVMSGRTREAGAVAGLRQVKNPILLARAVMEHSPHVMLVGEGAEAFARQRGVELVPASYFHTEERWAALQRALDAEARGDSGGGALKFGTVGAVALDSTGALAAGTSTGGMTNKRWGRVGDSPIIGAGTYADAHCAVSGTGHGEYFIRYTVARDICARVAYQRRSVEEAARDVLREVQAAGGEGGVIALDAQGRVSLPFTTRFMNRGYMGPEGIPTIDLFPEP